MRSLRLALLLLPTLAMAGWWPVGTAGVPQDVVVVDAGLVVAAGSTSSTAWIVAADGGVSTLVTLPGASTGAGLFDGGCLVALQGGSNIVTFSPGCGTPQAVIATTVRHLRVFAGDQLAMTITAGANTEQLLTGPVAATTWPQIGGWTMSGVRSLQTTRVGGVDYLVANMQLASFQLSVDGGTASSVGVPAPLRDLSPFERAGLPALVGVTTLNGLVLQPDVRVVGALTPTIPTGLIPRFVGMARGFGMVTTSTGVVLSPIPDPARQALTWRARTAAPIVTERVHCLDAKWCAATETAGQIWLYENAAAPEVVFSGFSADAGSTVRLVADAGDPDGDPVFLSWSAPGATFQPVVGVDDGFQVDLAVPPGAACGPLAIDLTARDGLHVVVTPVTVEIVGHGSLQTLAPPSPPYAGGPPVSVSAVIDGGCDPATIAWTSSDGQFGSGAAFSWIPPAIVCAAAGLPVSLTATASWGRGAPSTSSSVRQVTVQPWGVPEPPVFPGPAVQAGGTATVWVPLDGGHACDGTTGFPGTELVWDFVDGGGLPVQALDGGLLVGASSLCVPTRVVAVARRQVVGEQLGRLSDAGLLVVDVSPNIVPLDATTPLTVTAAMDAGVASGQLSVTTTCLPQRRLEAEVTVFDGTTPTASARFSTPGGWSLPVPGGCAGGTRDIVARLFEDGGATGAEARATVALDVIPVAVGAQSVGRLEVFCGVGARSTVSLLPVAGACQSAETSWRVVSGPSLNASGGTGSTFELQSTATDFSIVGQQLVLEWTVDAGGTNVATASRTIELDVRPFVEIDVQSSPVLRREEETFQLEVTLRNTTACAVDGLTLEVPVSGAVPMLGSVRVDGRPVPAHLEGSALVIEAVSLPADGRAVVRLDAYARLLSTPGAAPVASLHGLVVSTRAPAAVTPTGCGCTGAQAPSWLAFAGLLLLARRRRALRPAR